MIKIDHSDGEFENRSGFAPNRCCWRKYTLAHLVGIMRYGVHDLLAELCILFRERRYEVLK